MENTISLDLQKDGIICTFGEQPLRVGAEAPKDKHERFKVNGNPKNIIGGIINSFKGFKICIGHQRDPFTEPELLIECIQQLQKVKHIGVTVKTRSDLILVLASNLIASNYEVVIPIERPQLFARKNSLVTSSVRKIEIAQILSKLKIKTSFQIAPCPAGSMLIEEVEELYSNITSAEIEYHVISGTQILPSFLLRDTYLKVLDHAVEHFKACIKNATLEVVDATLRGQQVQKNSIKQAA